MEFEDLEAASRQVMDEIGGRTLTPELVTAYFLAMSAVMTQHYGISDEGMAALVRYSRKCRIKMVDAKLGGN